MSAVEPEGIETVEEPEVVAEEAQEKSPGFFAAQWKKCLDMPAKLREKGYPGLWAALIVAAIGIVGTILLSVLPGDAWYDDNYKLYVSLSVIVSFLTTFGAVWLGALLAYWGIVKSRRG
jgi:hypothetical protein